jgi:hypothetical protein
MENSNTEQRIEQNVKHTKKYAEHCYPRTKQLFYLLYNKEKKDFFSSCINSSIFSTELLLEAKIFKNKESAVKYKQENKLKDFCLIKIIPQYFYE